MDPAELEREQMLGPLALEVCEARAALEAATEAMIVIGRESSFPSPATRFSDDLRESALRACKELDRCKANYGVALSRYREVFEGADDPRR